MNKKLEKLKELYIELKQLVLLYDYAINYNNQINLNKKEKEREKVKKMVLKKKFHGKELVVD